MEMQGFMLTVEELKWLLGFAVAGYPVLLGAIAYLTKELLKAKDDETATLREILPLKVKLMSLCENMLEAIKIVSKKGGK